jgi:hypothetical protein
MGADLSLDLKMFAAKSLGRVRDAPAAAMDECIRRLEEEKGKIEVFRRELPLCARLLADGKRERHLALLIVCFSLFFCSFWCARFSFFGRFLMWFDGSCSD